MNQIHPTAFVPDSAVLGDHVEIGAGALLGLSCRIGNHVKIGMGAVIDDELYVDDDAVIGPGAVITMNVGPGMVMSGNPAKCVGSVTRQKPVRKEIKFAIPDNQPFTYCRGCNGTIFWIKTNAGKNMPVDPDGTPHWATCPQASKFKRRRA